MKPSLCVRNKNREERHERAVVAVQVAAFSVVLLGVAALTVDVGVMYNAKADLQRTVDAAALAAAAKLAEYDGGDPLQLARDTALDYVERNPILGQTVTVDLATDITFGRATFDSESHQYVFTPDSVVPDAVRMRVRKTDDSPNGALSLYFARVFGLASVDLSAEAVAVMVARDIAIVADLSGSHTDDSELRHYGHPYLTDGINLHDVWDALPGGAGEVGGLWNLDDLPQGWIEQDGSTPQAAGPGWGYMKELGYGTLDIDASYDPVADGGLIRLAYDQDWNDADLQSFLYDQGYLQSEVDAMLSSEFDIDGAYKYRVAVALGLAHWNSGHPGGLWEQRGVDVGDTGNGNDWVGSSELDWTEGLLGRSADTAAGIWLNYIDGYVRTTWNEMYKANSDFQYRFGIKTLTNYLLEKRTSHNSTPELAGTPTQPMQAVKDAVGFMVDLIDDLDSDDQLSLEIYGTTARHEVDLTHNHQAISDHLNAMQAAHYDSWTNAGGGLERAIEELTSVRARGLSRKVIILLTDGNANTNADGQWDYAGAADFARDQATVAADLGIRIVAVSVGASANQSLMQEIADIGHGEHFHAEGSINQYSQQLTEIFQRLGSKRPVELIQ